MHLPNWVPDKGDIGYVSIAAISIPIFYIYEVFYILPIICEKWSLVYFINFFLAGFLVHNVAGNIVFGVRGPGTIRNVVLPSPQEDWRLCSVCEAMTPPRSWHCYVCNVCILKRDHHCNFFGCCIGYYNYRYFYGYVFYIFVSTLYTFFLNLIYLSYYINWSASGWFAFMKFLFPFVAVFVDMNDESFHILIFIINVIANLFTGYLVLFYSRLILTGRITPDFKKPSQYNYNNGWKKNITEVFGTKWYMAWLSPFINSPFIGNGTVWKPKFIIKIE